MTLTRARAHDAGTAQQPAHGGRAALLDGLYEHSPWIAQRGPARSGPLRRWPQLKHALARGGGRAPARRSNWPCCVPTRNWPAKPMVANSLTAESSQRAKHRRTDPLQHPQEFAQHPAAQRRLQRALWLSLHPGGARRRAAPGLGKAEIIATFERRLQGHPEFELQECLRNVHRIAEIRLNEKLGYSPARRPPGVGLAGALAHSTATRAMPSRASSPSPT